MYKGTLALLTVQCKVNKRNKSSLSYRKLLYRHYRVYSRAQHQHNNKYTGLIKFALVQHLCVKRGAKTFAKESHVSVSLPCSRFLCREALRDDTKNGCDGDYVPVDKVLKYVHLDESPVVIYTYYAPLAGFILCVCEKNAEV